MSLITATYQHNSSLFRIPTTCSASANLLVL